MAFAQQRRLAAPTYIVAFALIILPIFDQMMQLVPTWKPHDPVWRFGALGMMSNMLILPVAGMAMAFAVAATFEHRKFQRVLSILSLISAVIIVVVVGLFNLDAMQFRGRIKPTSQALLSWDVATATADIKYLIVLLVLAGFAYAGLRVPKAPKQSQHPRASGLVIGSQKSASLAVGVTAKGDSVATTAKS